MTAHAAIWLLVTATAAATNDNNVEWNGVEHRVSSPVYRPDGERVDASDGVTLRVRSFQFDLNAVTLYYHNGANWQSTPARFDADYADCDGESLGAPCVLWVAAIPPFSGATAYYFAVTDQADTDYLGADVNNNAVMMEDAPDEAGSFQLAAPSGGKVIHVRAEGATQTLEVATAPCGIPGTFSAVTLGAAQDGWRTGTLNASPGERLAFKVSVDGQVRQVDRLGRPWTSTHDEVWLDRGLTYDVNPGSVLRPLVDSHTHPIATAQDLGFFPDTVTNVLDGHGVLLGLTTLDASQDQVAGLVQSRPDRFRALAWGHPTADDFQRAADLGVVEALLRDDAFQGIKLHPVGDSFPADAAYVDPYLDLAEKYRVPVVIHTEEQSGASPADAASPARVATLALRHPGVLVVMFHMDIAACDRTNVIRHAQRAPNILVETSWSNARQVRLAMCSLGAHRVMFGTDATTDGDTHYDRGNNILNAACTDYNQGYTQVIGEMAGSSPYAALSVQELASWQRDTAVGAFDLSLRPFPPAAREQCASDAPAPSPQVFPYPQNACADFP
ncbi:MAG: amidohydrolase family protein, partial [Myxococcota bacterium]